MQRTFKYNKGEIEVAFAQGVVRVDNDRDLWEYIHFDPYKNTRILVTWMKQVYVNAFGEELRISDNSLAMEIWGHIYFEQFLLRHPTLGRFLFPFGLYQRLVTSCKAVDCGESSKDSNRWLWDFLGILTPIAGRVIDRVRPRSN
jgi:hypothetical protein